MRWLVAAALACSVFPRAAPVPRMPAAEESYAKVELKGRVHPVVPVGSITAYVVAGGENYELDLWHEKPKTTVKERSAKVEELNGKLVIVHGRLHLRRGQRPIVEVTKLIIVPE